MKYFRTNEVSGQLCRQRSLDVYPPLVALGFLLAFDYFNPFWSGTRQLYSDTKLVASKRGLPHCKKRERVGRKRPKQLSEF